MWSQSKEHFEITGKKAQPLKWESASHKASYTHIHTFICTKSQFTAISLHNDMFHGGGRKLGNQEETHAHAQRQSGLSEG